MRGNDRLGIRYQKGLYILQASSCLNEAPRASSPLTAITPSLQCSVSSPFLPGLPTGKMDTHIADEKLKELHVEDTTVKANRDALQYEIDLATEKKLLRKIDLHVVPILWFLFMYVSV